MSFIIYTRTIPHHSTLSRMPHFWHRLGAVMLLFSSMCSYCRILTTVLVLRLSLQGPRITWVENS